MDKYILPSVIIVSLSVISTISGCSISDEVLWVKISETSWEVSGAGPEYQQVDGTTLFTFNGTGIFNNPHEEDYRVVHRDGCGFKAQIDYFPNTTIENPLEGTDFYPMSCFQALLPVDYPNGKTEFEIFGGIRFPGHLTTLPAGHYDLSIRLTDTAEEELTNINYMLLVDGELSVMLLRDFCGDPPGTTQPSPQKNLNVTVPWLSFSGIFALLVLQRKRKSHSS